MRDTFADDLEGVESACDYVSGEKDASFGDSECSFDGSFDEALGRLVNDFPDSLCHIFDEDIGIAENVDGSGYFVYFFEDLSLVEF